jgi:hypothetical protein
MELIEKAQDFYFYPNGVYTTISKWDSKLMTFDNDVSLVGQAIRIYGTELQIDRALDEYTNRTELNLDECYDFKIEKKGSHFYNREQNKVIAKKLEQYKKIYKRLKNKALILNLK